jgi:hypothetical protein
MPTERRCPPTGSDTCCSSKSTFPFASHSAAAGHRFYMATTVTWTAFLGCVMLMWNN